MTYWPGMTRRRPRPQVVAGERHEPEKTVFVKADARAPYGAVRTLLERLHDADIQDVILGTEELEKR